VVTTTWVTECVNAQKLVSTESYGLVVRKNKTKTVTGREKKLNYIPLVVTKSDSSDKSIDITIVSVDQLKDFIALDIKMDQMLSMKVI
jgi:hypothetical protein